MTEVAAVFEKHLELNEDRQQASTLLKIYWKLFDMQARDSVRGNAERIARQYGWHLGW